MKTKFGCLDECFVPSVGSRLLSWSFAQVATTAGVDAGGGRGGEHRARAARAGGAARVALPAARRGGDRGAAAPRVRAAPDRRAPLRRPPRVHFEPRCAPSGHSA